MNALKDHFKAWKETLLVLSYFALLALFVPQAKKHHLGTGGMFFVMIGCGILLAAIYFGFKFLRKWLQQRQISGREVRAYMSGSVAASPPRSLKRTRCTWLIHSNRTSAPS